MKGLTLTFLICLAVNSHAAKLANVEMADAIKLNGQDLVLNGQGLRFVEKLFMTFDVYVGGLYLPKKSQNPEEIIQSQGTKQLVLQFLRDVGKDKLTNAWDESFKKNSSEKQFAE